MAIRRKRRQDLWSKLLSSQRLYGQVYPINSNDRSEFQRDYDRIVFSSAFRRLQDKTQVFPLSQTDYTRTRLTHTLETSAVGRTIVSAKRTPSCKDSRRNAMLRHDQALKEGLDEVAKAGFRAVT
jgi:dGTP triphosphohydrolase